MSPKFFENCNSESAKLKKWMKLDKFIYLNCESLVPNKLPFVPGKSLQPSLIFESNPKAIKVEHLAERLLVLLVNIE